METWIMVVAALVGVALTPVCFFLILFYIFPHYIVRLAFMYRQYLAGMKIKYIGDENMLFCYAERNSPRPGKTSIVFVHGFSSSKDQWLSCFKGLPSDLHLIALDLPGHGFSSTPGDDVALDLHFVVDAVNKFLGLVGMADQKIHIVGSSLGGAIVGLYTAAHPENVEKVTMVCPAMQTPVDSDFAIQVKEAIALGPENITHKHCKLLPTDVTEVKAMFGSCCFNKDVIRLHDQFWKGIMHLRLKKTDFYLRLFKSLVNPEYIDILEERAHLISVPSQLIWGDHDELIHVSGAQVLKSKLPNCRHVDIIEKCGHAIDMDRPGQFNKVLLKFIREDVATQSEKNKKDT